MRLLVVIPAFNEQNALGGLLAEIRTAATPASIARSARLALKGMSAKTSAKPLV